MFTLPKLPRPIRLEENPEYYHLWDAYYNRPPLEKIIIIMSDCSPATYFTDTGKLHCLNGAIRSLRDIYNVCKYYLKFNKKDFHHALMNLCNDNIIQIHYCCEIAQYTVWYAADTDEGELPYSCYYGFEMPNNVVDLYSEIDPDSDIDDHHILESVKKQSRLFRQAMLKKFAK